MNDYILFNRYPELIELILKPYPFKDMSFMVNNAKLGIVAADINADCKICHVENA